MGRAICGGTLMNLSLRMSPTGFVLSFRSLLSCSSTRCSQLCSQRLSSSSLICSAHWVPCNQKGHFLHLIQQLFTQENLECQLQRNFLQAWWQFPSAASKALHNGLESSSSPKAEGKQRLWSDGIRNCNPTAKGRNTGYWQLTYPGITRPTFNSLFHSLLCVWPSASYCIQKKPSHFKFITPVLQSGIPNPGPAVQAHCTGCSLIYYWC